jgi:hypothetical protein
VTGSRSHAYRKESNRRGATLTGVTNVLHMLVEARALVALTLAAATGLWGLQTYPVQRDDVFLG